MADADPTFETDVTDTETATAPRAKRWRGRIIMYGLPLLVLLGGGYYWQSLQGKVSTDNAYLRQDKVSVGAEVSGPISQVLVKSGQDVTEGQVLFRIDARPYELQVAQANAAIASAQANVTALSNSSDYTGVDISGAREDIAFAQATLARQEALWRRGFTTKADYEAAQHSVSQAREQLRQAEADQQAARAKLATGAAVPGQNPQIAAAMAQRDAAMLNLSRATVRAPKGGRVAQADRLQVGQQAITGLPVLTIVANKESYIEANFKETELANMKVGQPAKITFDAYPDLELKGHVAYLGAGTGSEFSVIPAQNATGNWVKVTQRVPVRITIDEKSPRSLIAGLSTHVTVYTDGRKK
ncbi:MAG: HlyD family secretion protein [Novosphingobium sp.]|nr:HlyD family secretion protein [Novosphingobium sp.]